MHIFLIIALAIMAYLYVTGKMARNIVFPTILGLVALFMFSRGFFPGGAITSAIAAYLGRGFIASLLRGKKEEAIAIEAPDDVIQARALLGVSADDDEATIKQKYRKLLEIHHPDRGGDADYARAINIAKDLLIKHRLNNKL